MTHKFVSLSTQTPDEVRWAWPNRIPYGAVTFLDGDPGVGKTTLWADIAARLSSGRTMFNCDGKPSPKGVLLILAEDDLGSVIVPKLQAQGADLTRIRAYDGRADLESSFMFPDAMQTIEREAAEIDAKLIVIDPIMAFLAGNAYSDQSVRKTMGPLASFAERNNAAVLLVRHQTKGGARSPLYRGSGSIGLSAAARSGLLVASAPGDPNQRILAQYKSNYGRYARSLCFEITECGKASRIAWIGESRFGADELASGSNHDDRSVLQEAIYVIFSLLAEERLAAKEAKTKATDAGVSTATLKRAKKVLGVQSIRVGFGKNSQFFWELPEQDELVKRLRENEMDALIEKLISEPDDDASDWWKRGEGPDDEDDGGLPVFSTPDGDQG